MPSYCSSGVFSSCESALAYAGRADCRWIAQLFASADSHDDLQLQLKSKAEEFDPFRESVFKITVEAVNLHVSGTYMKSASHLCPHR